MEPINVNKAENDNSMYYFSHLSNGVKILYEKNESNSNKTRVLVRVGAGSLHDPEGFDGLAHACEHFIFLGSKKYKKPFCKSICQNQGIYNASTTAHDTFFSFTIGNKYVAESIDGLVDALINPLFNPFSIAAELKVIDNEFILRTQDAKKRINNLMNAVIPYNRTFCGNSTTLNHENLIDQVRLFHQQYYVGSNITVYISSNNLTSWDDKFLLFNEYPSTEVKTSLNLPVPERGGMIVFKSKENKMTYSVDIPQGDIYHTLAAKLLTTNAENMRRHLRKCDLTVFCCRVSKHVIFTCKSKSLLDKKVVVQTINSFIVKTLYIENVERSYAAIKDNVGLFYRKKYESQDEIACFALANLDISQYNRLLIYQTKYDQPTEEFFNIEKWNTTIQTIFNSQPLITFYDNSEQTLSKNYHGTNYDLFFDQEAGLSIISNVLHKDDPFEKNWIPSPISTPRDRKPLREEKGGKKEGEKEGEREDDEVNENVDIVIVNQRIATEVCYVHVNFIFDSKLAVNTAERRSLADGIQNYLRCSLSIFYNFKCTIISNSIRFWLQTKQESLVSALKILFLVPIVKRIRYQPQKNLQKDIFTRIDILDPLKDKVEEILSQQYIVDLKNSLSEGYKLDVLLIGTFSSEMFKKIDRLVKKSVPHNDLQIDLSEKPVIYQQISNLVVFNDMREDYSLNMFRIIFRIRDKHDSFQTKYEKYWNTVILLKIISVDFVLYLRKKISAYHCLINTSRRSKGDIIINVANSVHDGSLVLACIEKFLDSIPKRLSKIPEINDKLLEIKHPLCRRSEREFYIECFNKRIHHKDKLKTIIKSTLYEVSVESLIEHVEKHLSSNNRKIAIINSGPKDLYLGPEVVYTTFNTVSNMRKNGML